MSNGDLEESAAEIDYIHDNEENDDELEGGIIDEDGDGGKEGDGDGEERNVNEDGGEGWNNEEGNDDDIYEDHDNAARQLAMAGNNNREADGGEEGNGHCQGDSDEEGNACRDLARNQVMAKRPTMPAAKKLGAAKKPGAANSHVSWIKTSKDAFWQFTFIYESNSAFWQSARKLPKGKQLQKDRKTKIKNL